MKTRAKMTTYAHMKHDKQARNESAPLARRSNKSAGWNLNDVLAAMYLALKIEPVHVVVVVVALLLRRCNFASSESACDRSGILVHSFRAYSLVGALEVEEL